MIFSENGQNKKKKRKIESQEHDETELMNANLRNYLMHWHCGHNRKFIVDFHVDATRESHLLFSDIIKYVFNPFKIVTNAYDEDDAGRIVNGFVDLNPFVLLRAAGEASGRCASSYYVIPIDKYIEFMIDVLTRVNPDQSIVIFRSKVVNLYDFPAFLVNPIYALSSSTFVISQFPNLIDNIWTLCNRVDGTVNETSLTARIRTGLCRSSFEYALSLLVEYCDYTKINDSVRGSKTNKKCVFSTAEPACDHGSYPTIATNVALHVFANMLFHVSEIASVGPIEACEYAQTYKLLEEVVGSSVVKQSDLALLQTKTDVIFIFHAIMRDFCKLGNSPLEWNLPQKKNSIGVMRMTPVVFEKPRDAESAENPDIELFAQLVNSWNGPNITVEETKRSLYSRSDYLDMRLVNVDYLVTAFDLEYTFSNCGGGGAGATSSDTTEDVEEFFEGPNVYRRLLERHKKLIINDNAANSIHKKMSGSGTFDPRSLTQYGKEGAICLVPKQMTNMSEWACFNIMSAIVGSIHENQGHPLLMHKALNYLFNSSFDPFGSRHMAIHRGSLVWSLMYLLSHNSRDADSVYGMSVPLLLSELTSSSGYNKATTQSYMDVVVSVINRLSNEYYKDMLSVKMSFGVVVACLVKMLLLFMCPLNVHFASHKLTLFLKSYKKCLSEENQKRVTNIIAATAASSESDAAAASGSKMFHVVPVLFTFFVYGFDSKLITLNEIFEIVHTEILVISTLGNAVDINKNLLKKHEYVEMTGTVLQNALLQHSSRMYDEGDEKDFRGPTHYLDMLFEMVDSWRYNIPLAKVISSSYSVRKIDNQKDKVALFRLYNDSRPILNAKDYISIHRLSHLYDEPLFSSSSLTSGQSKVPSFDNSVMSYFCDLRSENEKNLVKNLNNIEINSYFT